MSATHNLERPNLSEAVAVKVRELIVDGRLRAGQRVNEVHLAARLGVSRTPLREALTRLVAEGALVSRPRCGFYVCPLSLEEFEQIYPIRALLDPEVLRLAGLPTAKRLARLEVLNRKLGEATDTEAVLALDDAWHLELLADCPNRILVGLIEQFMRRTRRYELALMREQPQVARAVQAHDEIMAALRSGDLRGACAALRRNMESGKAPIIAWLRERQARQEGKES
jgi:DNA-binding GntR family transcriptional regulator